MSTDDLIVRIGGPSDVHGVMKIAMAAGDENGVIPTEPLCLLREIWPALNLHFGAVGIVGPKSGEIEGAVLLRIGNLWYNDSIKVLEEKSLFVHPDYRQASGGRAAKLSDFAKRMAHELDLPLLIGVLSSQRTEAKIRFYQRQFGGAAGAYFIYNGHTGSGPPVEKSALLVDKLEAILTDAILETLERDYPNAFVQRDTTGSMTIDGAFDLKKVLRSVIDDHPMIHMKH